MGLFMIVIVVLIVAVLVYAATRPDEFTYQRSTTIAAPAESIFPLINDLRQWEAWSPWEDKDPGMQKSYSGSETGVGAVYQWQGNKEVGEGTIEFTEVTVPGRVSYKLHFRKPFEAHNNGEFLLEEQDGTTRITWRMSGTNNLMAKIFGLFVSFDNMIGKDFETGLARLKKLAEEA